MSTMSHNALIDLFIGILGKENVITSQDMMASYCSDWRGIYHGKALAVLRPENTQQCVAIVKLCYQYNISLIPQGGNTGLVGGATPDKNEGNVILSTSLMNKILECDNDHFSLLAQAGVTLKEAQDVAHKNDMLLPLSISSEGTAELGGVMATNAGGNNTLRYGNARERMIGLEVVLADGSLLNLLSDLRKDNTGYALRELFVGSEGTLGLITKVKLRLGPSIKQRQTLLCAIKSPQSALNILTIFRRRNPQLVAACEYMSAQSMALVMEHIENAHIPLSLKTPHDWLLLEIVATDKKTPLQEIMEELLTQALEAGDVDDAVIAQSEQQRESLWLLREEHSQAQKMAGSSVKNDISIPLKKIAQFIEEGTKLCHEEDPHMRVAAFGHIGDGNIHFNLVQAKGTDPKEFQKKSINLEHQIGELAVKLGGSFSAEHGIGQRKVDMMKHWKNSVEIKTMQAIKHSLDPKNIMNSGKLLP